VSTIEAGDAFTLNPNVSLRPEPFGALAYHFGTRRLSFLKEPALVEVVRALEAHDSVAETLHACGVPEEKHPSYLKALGSLVDSDMILPRTAG
jgi:putative mycofactocin binding protein MftB